MIFDAPIGVPLKVYDILDDLAFKYFIVFCLWEELHERDAILLTAVANETWEDIDSIFDLVYLNRTMFIMADINWFFGLFNLSIFILLIIFLLINTVKDLGILSP